MSCEEPQQAPSPYSAQHGIFEEGTSIKLNEIHLDSVLFADGKERAMLCGSFKAGRETFDFSILLNHFHQEGMEVLPNGAPWDRKEHFQCEVYWAEKDLVLSWWKNGRWLRLIAEKFNAER